MKKLSPDLFFREFYNKALPQILVIILFLIAYFSELHLPFLFVNIMILLKYSILWLEIVCWVFDVTLVIFTLILLGFSSSKLAKTLLTPSENSSGTNRERLSECDKNSFYSNTHKNFGSANFLLIVLYWLLALILLTSVGTLIFTISVMRKELN